jgi:Xaa-Pro aminopeptidase
LHEDVVALHKLLPGAEFVEAGGLLQEARMRKSDEEIELLRRASGIAREVLDALVAVARPGVTEAVVYAEMLKAQICAGAEPQLFNLLTSGPVDHPGSELWPTLHGREQPLTPSMRPLGAGDIVLAEWHTKYGGYLSHTEYTVYLGPRAPSELLAIWEVALACLDASKAALTPGRTLREAWTMVRAPAKEAGVDWVELGFHGHGLGSPEFPAVVYEEGYGSKHLNGTAIGDLVLEEGMTFGNNIDLHDSRWRVDVGCMLADFMVVRPGGAECLVGVPRELPQIG